MTFYHVYGVFLWGIEIPGKNLNLSIYYCHARVETKNLLRLNDV